MNFMNSLTNHELAEAPHGTDRPLRGHAVTDTWWLPCMPTGLPPRGQEGQDPP